jgi:DNA-binding transcriptional LysR family regulator
MLDVARLRVLVVVAEHGSVTAAAKALNFAQPSVSHHLARLQAETGVRLVTRVGRGIRLTPEGGRSRAGPRRSSAVSRRPRRSWPPWPGYAPAGCASPRSSPR